MSVLIYRTNNIVHTNAPFQFNVKGVISLMKTKKIAKIQNLKFHNSSNNFGRYPPWEYAWLFGSEFDVYF